MGWTQLPSVTVELPFLPRCLHTNMLSSPKRPPAVNGESWSVWFACLPCQVMGHIPQDPEESVRLAHPPLTPPLKDGEINWACVCWHLCACVGAEVLLHAWIWLSALCVHTWMARVQSGGQRGQVHPTQNTVSQFNHGSTSWWLWLPSTVALSLSFFLTHTCKHNHTHTIEPLFDLQMCVFGCNFFLLCLAASVNRTWKPILFLGEKSESL